jgi:hypothetical protein
MELTVALSILAVAMALVAQIGCWSLRERAQGAARQDALEVAANVLESALASPWETLTTDWAAAQRLPESLAQRLPDGRLTVRVEPEALHPRLKRVTVAVDWKLDNGLPARPLQLVGLFRARSADTARGKP